MPIHVMLSQYSLHIQTSQIPKISYSTVGARDLIFGFKIPSLGEKLRQCNVVNLRHVDFA